MYKRNILLDILKGVAILAVILYHLGVLTYGYLGVEVFLVIGGYLITKSMIRSKDNYWQFINKRFVRLWPLLLLISMVALALGWLWMLPIHYKLNCEAAIGTSAFLNNIVQYITSGGYWTADNEYKPLMHTWYVGIMMQFYALYPLVFIGAKKLTKDWVYGSFVTLAIVFALSLGLYTSSYLTPEQNFYFLPSRLFEFAAGGMVALYSSSQDSEKKKRCIGWVMALAVMMTLMLISSMEIDTSKVRLMITVALSTLFCVLAENDYRVKWQSVFKPIALCGTASFSLYLFHQVIFALYRYAFNDQFTILSYSIIVAFALVAGFVSFYLLEKPLGKFVKGNLKRVYAVNGVCVVAAGMICGVSYYYYKQNGLVRDIPELGMYIDGNHQSPEDYVDIGYLYDKDFVKNEKKNILVIGDSFGRDWINVLKESGVDSVMNISYHTEPEEVLKERLKKADYVFVANNASLLSKYSTILPDLMRHENFYRVGIKSFGGWIGHVYNNRRNTAEYYDQKVKASVDRLLLNNEEKQMFKEQYIDLLAAIQDKSGGIEMFNDEKELLTCDGIHLTRAGAQKYAKQLDVWQYLK